MPANYEIWVIGDSYMTFVAQHLEYWKEKARKDPHEAIYILRWFDVKAFPPNNISTNAVEVILTTLIGVLNTRPKLPHTLVIMLGDIRFWCDAQALRFTMDTIIKSLVKEIKRIIEQRQRDLPVKAVGRDPLIFFVKLNWKPEKAIDLVSAYPKKRRTFNKLLDSIVRPRGGNTILLHEINEKFDENMFLNHGELSDKGFRQIWASLSDALQDFETYGHQQKKEFVSVSQKETVFEVDSSDIIFDQNQFNIEPCTDNIRDVPNTPRIQNKRRFNKNQKGGFHKPKGRGTFSQNFFYTKF